jgi:hypothetical protein
MMAESLHSAKANGKGRFFPAEEQQTFRTNFNRASFRFSHLLAGHPLFQMDRLVRLATEVKTHPLARPDEVYFDAGDIKVTQLWRDTPKPEMSPEEAIQRIETAGAWMLIRRAELIDEYRIILDECMREIQGLVGIDLDAVMQVKNAIVFITSPCRITTYHIDRECNFLLQISGDKSISIFDKTDRLVLPETELESYWAVDNNAAKYKPELQSRANVYELVAGQGVHIPVNAPHWVQNGNSPSVSLSVNFEFKGREKSDVYRANYYLRRLGLRPTPPGQSELKDAIKRSVVLPAVQRARTTTKKLRERIAVVSGASRASEHPDPGSRRM